MDGTTTVTVLRVIQKHLNAGIDEAVAAILTADGIDPTYDPEIGLTDAEVAEIAEYFAADEADWTETGEEPGVTQKWPDGNVDTYSRYVTYRCESGPYAGLNLALGTVETPGKAGEIVGFVLGTGGGSRRPLTVFFPADDFGTTGERVSMIRGKGGGNSRKGYAPHEDLPPVYANFKTDVLAQRIARKWNVKAVVATDDPDGIKTMLNHTAIQARLRGIA